MPRFRLFDYLPLLFILRVLSNGNVEFVEGIGVNWGTMATHKLRPNSVVKLLQDNGINKVKLFDADQSSMSALAGTDIEVIVGIPNDQLLAMNDYDTAKDWVKTNVTRYNFNGGVNIKYVAVGNEPFLQSNNNAFVDVTFPALSNIQNALIDAGVGSSIKATVPLNADVYFSPDTNPVPSAGRFRADVIDHIIQILQFLHQNNAPLITNIYPFLSLYLDEHFPIDYAFFDGVTNPVMDNDIADTNSFDANFDTLVSALNAVGFGDMPILVGEIGWPTDGDKYANVVHAQRFYDGLISKLAQNKGTPLHPGYIDVYLFSLIDEDAKSVAPGYFERHFGIFRYDGQPKFPMDLSGQNRPDNLLVGAKDVQYLENKWCMLKPDADIGDSGKLVDAINYACTFSDCTSLGYGSSCGGMDTKANASYAFNMFFQTNNQNRMSCDFRGLAMITEKNISQGSCNFIIQITTSSSWRLLPLFLAFLMPFTILLI